MQGIYIHIPFCKSRCIYCDFYSTTKLDLREKYVNSLCNEMVSRHNYLCNEDYNTIYIGGGTPSQLSLPQLSKIIFHLYSTFRIAKNAEFTIEVNPDDISDELLKYLKTSPVNRISMGVQTFSDQRLQFLHRRHSVAQVSKAVELCRQYGFHNISIDLIFGFPNQILDEWKSDVSQALAIDVPHISAYSLMYEEGTRLTQMRDNGQISEIPDDTSCKMYDYLCTTLKDAGYIHYEISNFCKPNFHSRHNSSYWNNVPYLGLGAGAHSFDGNSRQWNSVMHNGEWEVEDIERLSPLQKYNEYIMTRLRTMQGVELDTLNSDFTYYFSQVKHLVDRHISNGNLKVNTDTRCLVLTLQGIHISNLVISDLMLTEE
ncbi:MAG: radical SAM family heme chaperone HemW [Prevotellaceae bacterium]|nr:radical SAM family heme chaperone HemW [Candidatus Colivivens equi]